MFKLMVAAIAVLCPIAASAQEGPKYEVFSGYSYLRGKGAAVPTRADANEDMHGWNISFARNFTDWFAIVGDFSGHYGGNDFRVTNSTSKNLHLLLFGYYCSARDFLFSRLAGSARMFRV